MSDIIITGQSLKVGFLGFNELCTGTKVRSFNGNSKIIGVAYAVPTIYGSGDPSKYVAGFGAAAPTPDSLVTVQIMDKDGKTYFVLLPPEAGGVPKTELQAIAYWQNLANACCGTNPAIPTVAIPDIANIEVPCPVIATAAVVAYPYIAPVPPLPAGQVYTMSGYVADSVNGNALGAFAPAAADAGYTTIAAALTAANALWGTKYGNGASGGFTLQNSNSAMKLLSGPAATVQMKAGQFNITTKVPPTP